MAQGRFIVASLAMAAFCGNPVGWAHAAEMERQDTDTHFVENPSPAERMVTLVDAIREAEVKAKGSALSAFVSGIDGMSYVVDVMKHSGIDQVTVNARTGQMTIRPIKRSPTWSPMHPIFTSSPGG